MPRFEIFREEGGGLLVVDKGVEVLVVFAAEACDWNQF